MLRIPEGWFLMGSDANQPGQDNERPVHRVWIDAFELAACQVTNADYGKFLAATGHDKVQRKPLHWDDPNFSHPEQPAVAPSWFDAAAYCEWLSALTTQALPPAHRSRMGTRSARRRRKETRPWGDEPLESLTNYASRWKTAPERVGRAEKNAYGLFDIGANIHEWCSDWFDADYYRISPDRNPQGPAEGKRKSSRGGSWRHQTKVSRCAARASIPPEFQYADYGFRVARDLAD